MTAVAMYVSYLCQRQQVEAQCLSCFMPITHHQAQLMKSILCLDGLNALKKGAEVHMQPLVSCLFQILALVPICNAFRGH